jgi:phage tail tube protein FII
MQPDSPNIIAVNLLKQAVESKGCHLSEVDIENMILKVNGPDDVVSDCARAVAEILD